MIISDNTLYPAYPSYFFPWQHMFFGMLFAELNNLCISFVEKRIQVLLSKFRISGCEATFAKHPSALTVSMLAMFSIKTKAEGKQLSGQSLRSWPQIWAGRSLCWAGVWGWPRTCLCLRVMCLHSAALLLPIPIQWLHYEHNAGVRLPSAVAREDRLRPVQAWYDRNNHSVDQEFKSGAEVQTRAGQ